MKWKKLFWYSIVYFLLGFLIFYVVTSIITITNYYSQTAVSPNKKVWGITLNATILTLEFFSTLATIMIYYYIGSSSYYKSVKDERNKYLTQDPLPYVVLAIPLYKEPLKVVSQTIQGALNIDYPKDRYKVVICDDSPSGQSQDIENYCKKHGVDYLRRDNRKGYKAGALNNALFKYESDFFAILDSDHIPTPNFFKTCMGGFIRDDIILVQGKPQFVNQDNYLQRSSAFIHTQFFHIYQKSRDTREGVIFAGTTGMFRTELLKQAGGFLEDTIAEDTDTSLCLIARGYKSRYIHEVCSKGLVPWSPISMINQVWRWTHGITSIFRRRLGIFISGKTSLINKIDMITTAFTPVVGIAVWFANLLLYIMYKSGIPLVRPSLTQYSIPLLLLAPVLISIASILMALIAWYREEKSDKMIKKRGLVGMTWTITAFYLLMVTAQSFLIWAVISGLLGIKKEFRRTQKMKLKTLGTTNEKWKYTLWSLGLFGLAVMFMIASYQTFIEGNAIFGWFIMAAVSLSMPIIITITYFPKLELLRTFAATKSAADVEREHLEKQS